MVIWLGAGPSRLSHRPPSSLPTAGARRLLGPADWLGTESTGASAAGGSCRLLITVAVLLMMRASSWSRGNGPAAWRAITIATLHHILINGAWAPGEG